MVVRLKEFIKQIRACKTAADERAVVAKESAAIRTLLKEDSPDHRHTNVAKLLYIHMLGYPAHFGQMECVKLVASPRFADKRLGYLGIMLLLDENQETLTLVTNSLKNDMNHPNMYVIGLALCTLGNISSVAMSRDLCPEVEKLLASSNSYIRKKAALCAIRIIRKVPDLMEVFIPRVRSILGERNHGALLTGLTLIQEMCTLNAAVLTEFRATVPALVKLLKQLITTGYSPEHDVSGITDPFLQVKILRLLRQLGTGDATASEQMNDVLAHVATNTDGSKNVGNAILYETVLTILAIQAEPTLRVLAINILGKFLANKDNNIRYVALQTLIKTIAVDGQAVQRHRATVLECLRDADVSIRRRALELAFALIYPQNVRVMTRELLAFLEVADVEFRAPMVAQICATADRFAPNKRWHLDTLIRVMKLAGNYVREETVAQLVRLATNAPDLQAYGVHKLYWLVKADAAQEGLVHAAVWTMGEFGDVLVSGAGGAAAAAPATGEDQDDEPASGLLTGTPAAAPTEAEVIALLESILIGAFVTQTTKQYVLTALMKLSTRFTGGAVTQAIQTLLQRYATSMNLELQQRSVEYTHMFDLDPTLRAGLWERMPVLELKEGDKYAQNAALAAEVGAKPASAAKAATAVDPMASALLDLDGLSLGGAPASPTRAAVPAGNPLDLMADLFSSPAPAMATSAAVPAKTAAPAQDPLALLMGLGGGAPAAPAPALAAAAPRDPLADLLGGGMLGSSSPAPAPAPAAAASSAAASASGNGDWNVATVAYQSSDLVVHLTPTKVTSADGAQSLVQVQAVLAHAGQHGDTVSDMQLLVAVPKTHKIQLAPMSSTTVAPGGTATQAFRILNPENKPIKLRLKVVYAVGARKVDEVVEFKFADSVL
ncbi:clathrin associated protein complex large subunit [Allomyces javanicus]|nr:clathrin associated protein complex large subunit [Allomyces javanicus]